MRVALVHDWLTGMRGGERCLEAFCELFPDADLYTLLHVPGTVTPVIERRRIVASFIQRLPGAARHYRRYLPLFPMAIARFDLSGYDLVLSSSHCVAKAARADRGAVHVSYCFTPMRYVWDRHADYVPGALARAAAAPAVAALRRWDRRVSDRVDHFMAISRFIAGRIRRAYGRDAEVIHPPVDVQRFPLADGPEDDFYLVVSALVPYKRIDLAIAAANRMRRRLLVVGSGPEAARLARLAGPTVQFLGWRADAEIAMLYRRCRALLFPGVEDFGIAPLEAMAAGRPVIALAAGGALETVVPPEDGAAPTGLFFRAQTVDALIDAIERLEHAPALFDPKTLRTHAEAFDRPVFKDRVSACLRRQMGEPVAC